jgi:hypothetical protein
LSKAASRIIANTFPTSVHCGTAQSMSIVRVRFGARKVRTLVALFLRRSTGWLSIGRLEGLPLPARPGAFFLRFFLPWPPHKVRSDFFLAPEKPQHRTIFFYWRRGAQHHMYFFNWRRGAQHHMWRVFFLGLARKRPRTTCDFFSVTAVPSQAVEGGLRLACRTGS